MKNSIRDSLVKNILIGNSSLQEFVSYYFVFVNLPTIILVSYYKVIHSFSPGEVESTPIAPSARPSLTSFATSKGPVKLIQRVKIAHSIFTVCVKSVPLYHFKLAWVA